MLEAYQSYGDYHSIADLTKTLVQNAAQEATGSLVVKLEDGEDYDFGETGPSSACTRRCRQNQESRSLRRPGTDVLDKIAADNNVDPLSFLLTRKYVEELWSTSTRTSCGHRPSSPTSPSTPHLWSCEHRTKKGVVEKWDLYVRGFELATGYSELVDPVIQRERFEAQAATRRRVTRKQWALTKTSYPWNTERRRPAVWEWDLIACSWL